MCQEESEKVNPAVRVDEVNEARGGLILQPIYRVISAVTGEE